MSLLKPQVHRHIYIAALVLLASSLPFSLFLLSISQFALIINWFAEGRVKTKFAAFFGDRTSLILSLWYFALIAGLLYTSDFNYALKDLRIKLPLLVLPLVIGTSRPLSRAEFLLVIRLFIAAVVTATLISTVYYFTRVVNDIRNISLFISHIRFGLMVCFALVIMFALMKGMFNLNLKERMFYAVLSVWLLVFLFISESVTGVSILVLLCLVLLLRITFGPFRPLFRIAAVLLITASAAGTYFYVSKVTQDYFHKNLVDFSALETHTPSGNLYKHDSTSLQTEKGNLVWIYICEEELEHAWEQRSSYDFAGYDDKQQYLQFTLIRYLTSKGLRKDAAGMAQLTDADIRAIEKGIPSVVFFEKMTLRKRIHEILWEYENYMKDGNANGLSVMMRIEFIKTALGIIRNNFVLGVGTGDINEAFKNQYVADKSLLKPEYQWRSHNQYLSVFVALGCAGFIIFLISLVYPPLRLKRFTSLIYSGFFIIIAVSMLTEDTLETQIGVTFFAFFNTLLLTGVNKESSS